MVSNCHIMCTTVMLATDDVCLLSVVEMRIERVIYETTEGDGSLQVCAVMESFNAVVDCLIGFTVYAHIDTADYTTGMYNITYSSISIDIHTSEGTCICSWCFS